MSFKATSGHASNHKVIGSMLAAALALSLNACNQDEEAPREKKERPREARKISAVSFVTYMCHMHKRIKSNWLPKTDTGKVGVVSFKTSKDGSIDNLKILNSSGDKAFDEAMIATVKASLPFPPLPAGAPASVPVEFTFDHKVFNHMVKDEPEELKKTIEKLTAQINQRYQNQPDPRADAKSQANLSAVQANNGELSALYIQRAKIWLHLDEKTKASLDFGSALSTDKTLNTALLKARTDNELGNYRESINACDIIKSMDKQNSEAYVLASDNHLNLGEIDEALEEANKAIELAPKHPDGYTARAYAYNLSFKYKKAIADCDSAIALDPACQAAYAYRGDAEEELKLYDDAIRDYSKNIELNPLDAGAILRRAELNNQMGHFHRAIIDCTEAIKLDPDNGEAFYYRSFANEQLSLTAQAKKDKEKAEALGFVGQ